ncbi:MAG: hypothetical protein ACP5O7_12420 [Phycisphaerae bacterium]
MNIIQDGASLGNFFQNAFELGGPDESLWALIVTFNELGNGVDQLRDAFESDVPSEFDASQGHMRP